MVNVPFIRLRLGTAGPFHRRATARTKMSAESEVATASQSSILPWWGRGLNPALTVRREPFPATPMGQVAMTVLSLQEAGERTGTSKVDIWRAIQVGTLSAKKTDDGGFAIDPSDLFAVFETKQVDQRLMAEDAAASVEASESPETSATPETVETELKGLPVLPAEAPIGDEPRQDWDQMPGVDLAERNAQLAEPAAERAKVEKMANYAALSDEQPWWTRLVGWIRPRRGRAARKRLRERL
jgi:hypothetical protein